MIKVGSTGGNKRVEPIEGASRVTNPGPRPNPKDTIEIKGKKPRKPKVIGFDRSGRPVTDAGLEGGGHGIES